jgi:protein-disulfide isomerase
VSKPAWIGWTLALIGGVALGATGVHLLAPASAPTRRADVELVVREYILDHPEILPEAMKRLQARETRAMIGTKRAALEAPFAGAAFGPEDADVIIVEFTDYACGYCRRTVADLDRLLAEDKRVRVVFRELPILSSQSDLAARAALAAARVGRYEAVHRALFSGGQLTPEKIQAVSGGSDGQGDQAIAAEIERNIALAQSLQVSATPSFVIGDRIISGAIGYEGLKAAVAEVRAARRG